MFSLFFKPLAAGTPAPPFICPDEEGNVFILNQQRGKFVVLIFYPRDETPGCTEQLCALRDHWEALRARNAIVVGINPGSAQSHRAFRARHKLPFPLLVDDSRRVARLYRSAGLLVRRTVYLIDPRGVIRFSARGKPPIAVLMAALDKAGAPAPAPAPQAKAG